MKKVLSVLLIASFGLADACTSFGVITNTGTVVAKNRDYEYSKQNLETLVPNRQFFAWYQNPYGHKNRVFALTANNDVKMATNENGLTAIEEDPPYPKDSGDHRRYIQPYGGYSEGMTLWAVAQNFNTVKELLPYIKDVFTHAAPNYYEIADDKQILIVEVAYGKTDNDQTRPVSYKLINKNQQYYTHTNFYMANKFSGLNKLTSNQYSLAGAVDRNNTIESTVKANMNNLDNLSDWLLNTKSTVKNPNDANWCLNTSIFRSNLQGESFVDTSISNDKVYGTISSWVVTNNGGADKTTLAINLVDGIKVLPNGNQEISYRKVRGSLVDLINGKINYESASFVRNAPKGGNCE
jgi:hypothetical protein